MKALVIAGTHSGVGKTTVSVGIMAALRRRGLKVQSFKVGPDFIDPGYHLLASGRVSRNLDGWMLGRRYNLECFAEHSKDADIAVVEGAMGLFDGCDGKSESGSTAEIAKLIGAPVVLVVDAWSMARSAAALVLGFERFDPELQVRGVIFNRIAGPPHLKWIEEAVERTSRVRRLGGLPKRDDLAIPERHLGLLTTFENRPAPALIEELAGLVERSLSLDALLEIASGGRTISLPEKIMVPENQCRIAVALDEAFCFYYRDNFDLLERYGAGLVFFSPLRDEALPDDVGGVYLGGGYPEVHASALEGNASMRRSVREFALRGGRIYAECGGLMYLGRAIEYAGSRHEMVGLLPFSTRMAGRLALSYVEIETTAACRLFGAGQKARGHEFHCSELVEEGRGLSSLEKSYLVFDKNGSELRSEGYSLDNVLASYLHLHFGSNPELARRFVEACAG